MVANWREWVVGRRTNRARSRASCLYTSSISSRVGHKHLDEIRAGRLQRQSLPGGEGLTDKTIKQHLTILSSRCTYAVDVDLIAKAPRWSFQVEPRRSIWEIEQYAPVAHGGGEGGPVVQAACHWPVRPG